MDDSDELLCLFSAAILDSDGRAIIEIPRREVETGPVELGERYRVALITAETPERKLTDSGDYPPDQPQPPVEQGEIRYVDIEDLGKQGDGIARVERGYVIIVPDSEVGDRVKIEITEVKPNFAVGEILETA